MYLMYHRSTSITGRALANLLHLRRTKRGVDAPVVIRWGNSLPTPNDKAINSAGAIGLASHGLNSLVKLREKEVPAVVPFYRPPEDESLYPVFGRRINHRAGRDIVICNTIQEAYDSGRPYFTQYEEIDREFRVHVFGGKVLRIFRKVGGDNHYIRTSETGWSYSRVALRNYDVGREIAIKAVEALGLTFGGVDLGFNVEKGRWVVFEVNTGPSLNTVTQLYYAREFEKYLLELGVGYVPCGRDWTTEIERRINRDYD